MMTNFRLQELYGPEKWSAILSHMRTIVTNNQSLCLALLPLLSQFLSFCNCPETTTQIRNHAKVKELERVR